MAISFYSKEVTISQPMERGLELGLGLDLGLD